MTKTQKYIKGYYNRYCNNNGFWTSLEEFTNYIGSPPKSNMKLSRKCIRKGYVRGNLMWTKTPNRKSRYPITMSNGNVASLRSACEQESVKYSNVYQFIRNYGLGDSQESVYNFYKLDKHYRQNIKHQAIAQAVKTFQKV